MYIRFVCAEPHPYARAELGLYMGHWLVDWRSQPDWLRDEYSRALDAALGDISAPMRIATGLSADGRRALCWFVAANRDRVAAMRHFAWVIEEMGLPTAEITTRNPGRIIYRDPDQVAALPRGPVRRAFPRPGLEGRHLH